MDAFGGLASLKQLEVRKNELPQPQASVWSTLAVENGSVCGFCSGGGGTSLQLHFYIRPLTVLYKLYLV